MPGAVAFRSLDECNNPVLERRTELLPGSRLYGPEDVLGSFDPEGFTPPLGSPLADFLTGTYF